MNQWRNYKYLHVTRAKSIWKWAWCVIRAVNSVKSAWIKIVTATATAAKSLQSCPTLCDPIDSSPPGSPFPGIHWARTLEWVATSFSNAWKWKVKAKSLSRVWLSETPWMAAHQASPSMGFSRQEYWSGLPLYSLVCGYKYIKIKRSKERRRIRGKIKIYSF